MMKKKIGDMLSKIVKHLELSSIRVHPKKVLSLTEAKIEERKLPKFVKTSEIIVVKIQRTPHGKLHRINQFCKKNLYLVLSKLQKIYL